MWTSLESLSPGCRCLGRTLSPVSSRRVVWCGVVWCDGFVFVFVVARGGRNLVISQAGWTTGIKWIKLESVTRGTFCLVDMPGYGDAVATERERFAWVSE